MAFKVGDVVRLKSGGPRLTVRGPSAVAKGETLVIYFTATNEPKLDQVSIPEECLELATDRAD